MFKSPQRNLSTRRSPGPSSERSNSPLLPTPKPAFYANPYVPFGGSPYVYVSDGPLPPRSNAERGFFWNQDRSRIRDTTPLEYKPITSIEKEDPIWPMYIKEARLQDKEMLDCWSAQVDVLLVFAGLFSAVLTTFVVEVYRGLKQAPSDLTNELLTALVHHLTQNETAPPNQPFKHTHSDFTPTSWSVRVNFCWFSSLAFSLLTMAGAILAKQWIQEHRRCSTNGSPHDQALQHQELLDALGAWHFSTVLDMLPAMMHLSLVLFSIGLIDFLCVLHRPIGTFLSGIFSLGVMFTFTTTLCAASIPCCPYKTSLSLPLSKLLHAINDSARKWAPSWRFSAVQTLVQRSAFLWRWGIGVGQNGGGYKSAYNVQALMWLMRRSRDDSTVHAVLKLVPALSASICIRAELWMDGAIARLCELFHPSHPQYSQLIQQDHEVLASGLALRSLLLGPRPNNSKSLTLQDALGMPLNFMISHPNVNIRILARSIIPLAGIHIEDKYITPTGWGMAEEVGRSGRETHLWARVLLLDTLQEWVVYLRECAPASVCRAQHNSPEAMLRLVMRIGVTAPEHHITLELLSAFLGGFSVVLGGQGTAHSGPSDRTAPSTLGPCLLDCLQRMQQNRMTNQHSDPPILISPNEVEESFIQLLSIINRLLIQYPTMFGSSWSSSIPKLIELAQGSSSQDLIGLCLKTISLCPPEMLELYCSPKHLKQVWGMSMASILPCLSSWSLDALKFIAHVLPLLEEKEVAYQDLISHAGPLSALILHGVQQEDVEAHSAITVITDQLLENPRRSSTREATDSFALGLIEAGLLRELVALLPVATAERNLEIILKTIGSIAHSSTSGPYLLEASALSSLLAVVLSTSSDLCKGLAVRVIMIWCSVSIDAGSDMYLYDMMGQVASSGLIVSPCSWLGRYMQDWPKFYDELAREWLPSLIFIAKLHPTSFIQPFGSGSEASGLLPCLIEQLCADLVQHPAVGPIPPGSRQSVLIVLRYFREIERDIAEESAHSAVSVSFSPM